MMLYARSCERPSNSSASVFFPSSVSNSYSFSTGTQGSSSRFFLTSSLSCACSPSSFASSSRAACHSSRVPTFCSGISLLLSSYGITNRTGLGVETHRCPRVTSPAMQLLDRRTLLGADPHDDEDMRARKALLVLISVLILPVAASWGALYLAFGSPVGVVPLVYFAVLFGAIAVFSRTRDFPWLLRVNQVDILLAPTLSMIPLGGVLEPLGALVFSEVRSAARWYVAYVVVFLGSGAAGELVGQVWSPLPGWFTSTMLALNIAVGGAIVFTLLAVFASQRREALAALRLEQAKAESLLLNILPRSIADKLKAQTRPIADQFESASILFADVVDFTPWSERLPPAEVVGY